MCIRDSINGISVGILVALIAGFWQHNPYLGLVIGLAMVGNLIVAAIAGVLMPMTVSYTHLDVYKRQLLTMDGAMCVAVVDANSGMVLGTGGSGLDLEVAAAGNTEVVRSKQKTMRALGLKDHIEDILITLGTQYHICLLYTSRCV